MGPIQICCHRMNVKIAKLASWSLVKISSKSMTFHVPITALGPSIAFRKMRVMEWIQMSPQASVWDIITSTATNGALRIWLCQTRPKNIAGLLEQTGIISGAHIQTEKTPTRKDSPWFQMTVHFRHFLVQMRFILGEPITNISHNSRRYLFRAIAQTVALEESASTEISRIH